MNQFDIAINLCIILFFIFLLWIYFSKENNNNQESKIYKYLLIINGIVLSLNSLWLFGSYYLKQFTFFLTIEYNLYSTLALLWSYIICYYIILASNKDNKKFVEYYAKNKKSIKIFLTCCVVITCVIDLFLPTQLLYSSNGVLTGVAGPNTYLWYIISFALLIVSIVTLILNRKSVNSQKIFPYGLLVFVSLLLVVFTYVYKSTCLAIGIITVINYILYFTMENPDIRLITNLREEKDSAIKSFDNKNNFLNSLSKQIRMPLNSIVGLSQMIGSNNNIEEIHEDSKDIVIESENLLELIDDILDINKIEANEMEVIDAVYSPSEIINELIRMMDNRLQNKDVEFKTCISKELPFELFGDREKVKRIISNLLTNAVKFTEHGSIEFKVSCSSEKEICNLKIMVKDTGIGIKQEQIDSIFTKFFKLEDSEVIFEGAGLGLAITKSLVNLLQGSITVDSVYGQGSTFTVMLSQRIMTKVDPNKVMEEASIQKDANVVVKSSKSEVQDNGNKVELKPNVKKKILVVDDNKLNLKVAYKCLQAFNFDVDTSQSGFDCLDKVNSGIKYDLVFMDIMMPKMDGVETMKKLKAIDKFKSPIIALTADAIEGSREKYLSAGFDDYLSKPIDQMTLGETLNKFASLNVINQSELNDYQSKIQQSKQDEQVDNSKSTEVL